MYLVYRAGIVPGQFWSLYTVDLATSAATFVGEIQPERNIDALAVAPPSFVRNRTLATFGEIVGGLDGPANALVFGPCIASDDQLNGDGVMDLRDVPLFLNDPIRLATCGN